MPTMEPLSPPYGAKNQSRFGSIMPDDVPPLLLFRTISSSERAWRKFGSVSLLDVNPLSLRERESVLDRTCALDDCEYDWGVHVASFAEKAGLSEREILASVHDTEEESCWPPAEQALVAATDARHLRARLDEAEFMRLRTRIDEMQIFEVIQFCGFYRTVAYLTGSLDPPPEWALPVFPLLQAPSQPSRMPKHRMPN